MLKGQNPGRLLLRVRFDGFQSAVIRFALSAAIGLAEPAPPGLAMFFPRPIPEEEGLPALLAVFIRVRSSCRSYCRARGESPRAAYATAAAETCYGGSDQPPRPSEGAGGSSETLISPEAASSASFHSRHSQKY
eukprot:SAG31_NODE_470_length_15239_cov_19.376288_11_plen_134_part_00